MRKPETLVLALGNPLLGDDAVAFHILRLLRQNPLPGVVYRESEESGLALLDLLSGYRRCLILDSIHTGQAPPGTVHDFTETVRLSAHAGSAHYAGLPEVLALAEKLGTPMPEEIYVLGIEIADPYTIREGLTPELEAQLPQIAQKVQEILRRLSPCGG